MYQAMRHLIKATCLVAGVALIITCSSDKPTQGPTNHAPSAPANDVQLGSPSQSATGVSRTPVLRWTCSDPDNDALKYDVYFGGSATPLLVSSLQAEVSYAPATLTYSTTYYWRVVALDQRGGSTSSDTWSFTTMDPPTETISDPSTPAGPSAGNTNEDLTYSTGGAVSSFGHSIQYRLVWSDGDTSVWAGATSFTHAWPSPGVYSVRSQARCAVDTAVVSFWSGALTVTISAPPVCTVEPSELSFDSLEVGASLVKSFTITNTGGGTLSGSIEEDCPDFEIISGGGSYGLSGGQSVSVQVQYTPTTEGALSCAIETGGQCGSDVACSGRGYRFPVGRVNPDLIDFGAVTIGEPATRHFVITNVGGGVLNLFVPTYLYGDFRFTSGAGARSLLANESLAVAVQFEPQTSGQKVTTIDFSSPYCDTLTLRGTAIQPPYCVVTNTALDFGTCRIGNCTSTQWVSIQNQGGGTLTGNVTEDCPAYEIVSGGGPFSLSAGTTIYVQVRFCPQGFGIVTCTIDLGTSCSVDVTCTGMGLPI